MGGPLSEDHAIGAQLERIHGESPDRLDVNLVKSMIVLYFQRFITINEHDKRASSRLFRRPPKSVFANSIVAICETYRSVEEMQLVPHRLASDRLASVRLASRN
jgi:hypothetical protein